MAVRYTGEVTIRMCLTNETYRCTLSAGGRHFYTMETELPEDDKRRLARDCPEAFDMVARAAVGFAIGDRCDDGIFIEYTDDLSAVLVHRKPTGEVLRHIARRQPKEFQHSEDAAGECQSEDGSHE